MKKKPLSRVSPVQYSPRRQSWVQVGASRLWWKRFDYGGKDNISYII